MFEVVSVIDLNKNRFTPLLGDNKFFSDYGSDELGLQDKLDIIAKKRMHPDEKEIFTSFADFTATLSSDEFRFHISSADHTSSATQHLPSSVCTPIHAHADLCEIP